MFSLKRVVMFFTPIPAGVSPRGDCNGSTLNR